MSQIRSIKRYGWVRDLPDHRDLKYPHKATLIRVGTVPPSIDLRPGFPDPYDQGNLGSCTANGAAGSVEFLQIKEHKTVFVPSRLFIYYYERVMEGTVDTDSGASIRDSMKVISANGSPPETMWPYDISKFTVQPTPDCVVAANKDLITQYLSVLQNRDAIKACLVEGYPINFGFTVYDSFESDQVAQTGLVPMPGSAENVLGGHAVIICGYDDNMMQADRATKGCYIFRNSWGTSWAKGGYGFFPYSYVEDPNLADDFWTPRLLQDTI